MPTSPAVANSVKAKLDALMNVSTQKQLIWRPPRGKEVSVRIIPYKHAADPFNELYFHYDVGPVKSILCPRTAGVNGKCPICDYAEYLRKLTENKEKNWALYKRLSRKMRTHVPVIVRGEEESGVKFWGIGKNTYKAIGQLWLDPEYGELSDPVGGRDIKVLATNPTPQFVYGQVQIRPAANVSPLSTNVTIAKKWISECPSIFEAWQKSSEEEIQQALDTFIESDKSEAEVTESKSDASETATDEFDFSEIDELLKPKQ